MNYLRFAVSTAALLFGSAGLHAAGPADDMIAKARAFLGTESALNAIKTIHYTGTLEFTDRVSSDGDKTKLVDQKINVPIEIHFQKPMQQCVMANSTKVLETTALDGYDGWQRRQDAADPTKWQLTLLDKEQIKRLQANTWENLNFFKGPGNAGGRVDYLGEARAEGRDCVKLAYVHAPTIIFYRYFDKLTGRLLLTETESGAMIREEGQMVVNGVRFPKKVVNKGTDGRITVITFDQVIINETLAPSLFAVPSLSIK
ncbi:MAG: hypothetical protein PHQ04_03540 [Opitutaceae bacterium]|nr:hypothetical protein [Opitutaceae bacterium]